MADLATAEQCEEIERLVRSKVAPTEKWIAICRMFGITSAADLLTMTQEKATRFIRGMEKQADNEE